MSSQFSWRRITRFSALHIRMMFLHSSESSEHILLVWKSSAEMFVTWILGHLVSCLRRVHRLRLGGIDFCV